MNLIQANQKWFVYRSFKQPPFQLTPKNISIGRSQLRTYCHLLLQPIYLIDKFKISTYNYKLAKFLVPILQPLTSNQFTVKDSFYFANEISSLPNHSYFMTSFDVTSLFTNFPLEECINLCVDQLFSDRNVILHNDCRLDKPSFHKLLTFAVKDNHFVFNGQLYDQIDGVAMGSPLGPSLANLFMCALEQKFLDECPLQFKPVLYRRYVDDTLCLFENEQQADLFLKHINSYHGNIKFAVEKETNNTLPFLDILIHKDATKFSTSLYRKPTFTGLYTDFSMLSPHKYKVNLISVLIFRAFKICSSYTNFHDELLKIKLILAKNCYPSALVDDVIRKFLNERFSPSKKPPVPEQNKQRIVFCIPFLGHLSYKLRNNITKLIKAHYPNVKLQFVYKSPKRLSSIFKIKDLLPSLVCSNVICKYSCSGCSATYYGKTSRNLKIRCYEHLGTNKSGGKRACPSSSSVGDHIKQSGHEGTLEDFSIISKTNMTFDLFIHESLLIQRDRPTLNS